MWCPELFVGTCKEQVVVGQMFVFFVCCLEENEKVIMSLVIFNFPLILCIMLYYLCKERRMW